MPKWFSSRVSISRACRLSMPSFLKKSSSGDSELAGTLKCVEANSSTSAVVCSSVRIRDKSITGRAGLKIPEALRRAGSEQQKAVTQSYGDRFGACSRAEFAENRRYMKLRGVLGNAQARGDLLVQKTGGKHLEDLKFALGQRLSRGRG